MHRKTGTLTLKARLKNRIFRNGPENEVLSHCEAFGNTVSSTLMENGKKPLGDQLVRFVHTYHPPTGTIN